VNVTSNYELIYAKYQFTVIYYEHQHALLCAVNTIVPWFTMVEYNVLLSFNIVNNIFYYDMVQ